jgi:hypothetical protein
MRIKSPKKIVTWALLIVTLFVTINCVHESAHAVQRDMAATGDTEQSTVSASHQCPFAPLEQHEDYDGCDACVNCACHAPLAFQQFQLSYRPMILALNTTYLFKHPPEVFLPKFIPPQNKA